MIYTPFDHPSEEPRFRRGDTSEQFDFHYSHDPVNDGRSRQQTKEEMLKQFHKEADGWLDSVKGRESER